MGVNEVDYKNIENYKNTVSKELHSKHMIISNPLSSTIIENYDKIIAIGDFSLEKIMNSSTRQLNLRKDNNPQDSMKLF